jgi:VWFA-related protein
MPRQSRPDGGLGIRPGAKGSPADSAKRGRLIALVGAALATAGALAAQPPSQPIFRSGTNLVEVDVVVTDARGMPVTGLSKDDFTVLEDGKPQTVEAMVAIDLPYTPGIEAPRTVDKSGAALAVNEGRDGRIIVLAIDEWHLRPDVILKARRVASMFIDQLGPTDSAAVITLPRNRFADRDFTGDRASLLKGVNAVMPSNAMGGAEFGIRGMFARLRDVARELAPVRQRRKTIVLISQGMPLGGEFDPADPISATSVAEFNDFVEVAHATNVAVYSIDPSGVDDEVQTNASRDTLRALAEQTGGRAVVNTEGFEKGIARVMRDSGSYYVLGYVPQNAPDGKRHRISVQVKRPGVEVRARRAYMASKPVKATTARTGVSAVIASPIQTHGLAMRAMMIPVPSAAKTGASILICAEIDSRSMPAVASSGDAPVLEIMSAAVDGNARVRASDSSALKPSGSLIASAGRWIRVAHRLDVAPGHHYIRFAALNPQSGISGSVFQEIDVPSFSSGDVILGGLALIPAERVDPSRAPKLNGLLPAPAFARSSLSAADRASAFVRVRARPIGSPVEIVTTLSAGSRVVVSNRQPVAQAELAAPAGAGVLVPITETPLEPGDYTLKTEARRSNKTVASRELRFSVVR